MHTGILTTTVLLLFFFPSRQSHPILDKYILQSALVFCNFWSTKEGKTAATKAPCRRLGREREKDGWEEAEEIILQEMRTRLSQRLQKTNSPKMTQIHTQTQERGQMPSQTKTVNTHMKKHGSAHTPGWPFWWLCLFAIGIGHFLWVYLLATHTHTHVQNHTERYCFSSGVRLTPDGPTDSADSAEHIKPKLAPCVIHTVVFLFFFL